jgi:ferritin-like protein
MRVKGSLLAKHRHRRRTSCSVGFSSVQFGSILLGLQSQISVQLEEKNPMATSAEWHENYEEMSEEVLNFSRAVKSVQEELEAVDWYNQRAQATKDDQLRRILEHNRDEEVEHAMMGLEYLRRVSPVFDKHMKTYLFTKEDILEVEEKAEE